jgi:signal transduction histidine kinase
LADKFNQEDRRVIESGLPCTINETIPNKDGIVHAYIIVKFPLKNISGDIYAVCGIATDITEQKKQEEKIKRLSDSELNKTKLAAEKANKAKSEFLSQMSHELRTPMNAVLGFAQLLEMDELNEDQHESVKYILSSGHHLLNLINDILDLSKIEADKLALMSEPLDLKIVLYECLSLMQPLAVSSSIQLVNNLCNECDAMVIGDSLRVKQILLNLISNAIKYNRTGGVVMISCENINSQSIIIKIADTGKGLSESQLSKLFQPFERLDAKNSTIEGTGIGLCISKKLIEAMGGKIGVTSAVDEGSCFWIELPLA